MTAAGLIRTHGPVDKRCPGSCRLPAPGTSEVSHTVGPRGTDHPSLPPLPPATQLNHRSHQSPLKPIPPVRILKWIPRASREQAGMKLTTILEGVVSKNDVSAWERLLHFSARCLRVPTRCGRNWSLATLVNGQLKEEKDPPTTTINSSRRGKRRGKAKDPMESLGHRVSEKLEEGDFKGAVRLACSEDSMAVRSDATFAALKEKHPPPHPDSDIPPPPDSNKPLLAVSEEDVAQAIRSFPNGSAGGPDGLRPQHLKDMTNSSNTEASSLLTALASFSTLVLEGKTPPAIHPFLFGATLTALDKKGGG